MTRLIDMYASQHDIAESSVAFVDAEPAEVLEVLERVDLSGPGIDAAAALGLTGDITFGPERVELWSDREQLYGLTWRVRGDEPGYVAVVWDVRVEAGAEAGTMLSSTRRFIATDTASRDRLGTAWPIVGPLTTALAQRAVATVKRLAEAREDEPAATSAATPLLLVAA